MKIEALEPLLLLKKIKLNKQINIQTMKIT